MERTVLIVDDEKNILVTLGQALQLAGYQTELAASGKTALDIVAVKPIDAVLMDVKMPDLDGLAVIEKLSALRPNIPVIMMSGHATIDVAVKATQLGARDFLEKPIARERLLVALRNALSHQAALEELAQLRAQVGEFEMVGRSGAMQRVYELIRRAAPSEGRVLITGENGSGKELVAKAIHLNSRRRAGPFVQLNCAAVPHELIESELFGHERGAFTGAVSARRGKFELASDGTLFLDEVGDMTASMQAKVLRVLQQGELERVGGTETLKVDVRVIAATNRDLEAEIRAGRFREDLFYRLNVVHLHVPPLRERREDLGDLIDAFLKEASFRNGKRPMQLSPEALSQMMAYEYPGNVRELKNLVERLAILCPGPTISAAEAAELLPRARGQPGGTSGPQDPHLPAGPAGPSPAPAAEEPPPPRVDRAFRDQVEDAEREIILKALAFTRDNVTEAAKLLDLERGHFYKKMKALGLRRGGGDKEGG
jgi:DNA-binding NtrC family response regulator